MNDPRIPRRLAAILAADVVGYSRLMGADEAGTLVALRARWKDVLTPMVARHSGRIVKVMGDGVLVEFASAVDAVECALAVQAGFAAANDGLAPDRRIVLRIGINLGDVIVEGGDLYGDGVNIAARLEGIADPGGICLSAAVHDQVRGKVAAAFEDMGPQRLKNITESLRVFRLHPGDRAAVSPAAAAAEAPAAAMTPPARPSVGVLAFSNLSGDPEQAYFSDGISEDIITELARVRDLRVASRNASFRFRDANLETARLGRELGVQYLVLGSVRRSGKRLRISAQLTEAETGTDLWAEKFDRDQEELFAVQDKVARVIVATLVGRIENAVTMGAKRRPPASLAAYECVLQAEAMQYADLTGLLAARRLLERAVALDPGYALAFSHLANSYRLEWLIEPGSPDHLLDQALAYVRQALSFDPNHDACHQDIGLILTERREWALAEHHINRALALNPNSPVGVMCLGYLYTHTGRPGDALDLFETARQMDPFFEPPWFWRMQGAALFVAGSYEASISSFRKSATLAAWAHGYLAAACAYLGQPDLARRYTEDALRLSPDFTIRSAVSRSPFMHDADLRHLIEGLRRAGVPE